MKHLNLILFLSFAYGNFALAVQDATLSPVQTSSISQKTTLAKPSRFQLAPIFGVTNSRMTGLVSEDLGSVQASNRVGALYGAQFLYCDDKLCFETGLQYAERGATIRKSYTAGGKDMGYFDSSLKLKYIEVPVLGRYYFAQLAKARFFANGGLVIGSLQGYQDEVISLEGQLAGGESLRSESGSAGDRGLKSWDFRGALGTGASVSWSNLVSWTFGADLQSSLGRINKQGNETVRNFSLGLYTGLLIAL